MQTIFTIYSFLWFLYFNEALLVQNAATTQFIDLLEKLWEKIYSLFTESPASELFSLGVHLSFVDDIFRNAILWQGSDRIGNTYLLLQIKSNLNISR